MSLAIQGQMASSGFSMQKPIAHGTAPHHVRDFSSLASIALQQTVSCSLSHAAQLSGAYFVSPRFEQLHLIL